MVRDMTFRRRFHLAVIAALALVATSTAAAIATTADASYGDGGIASTDLPGVDYAMASAAQPDGKLVLAGAADGAIAVVRFTSDGSLDPTFAGSGVARVAVGSLSAAGSVSTGTDGSIYVAGWAQDRAHRSDSKDVDGSMSFALDRVRLVLVKLTPEGVRDPSFGSNGVMTTGAGVFQPVHDIHIDMVVAPDGAITVLTLRGASAGWYGFAGSAVLVRFTLTGAPDRSFGIGGVAAAGPPEIVPAPTALALQPDGRVLVGTTWMDPGLVPFAPPSWDLLVSRHLPGGGLDPSFGVGGVVRRDIRGGTEAMRDLSIDRDGRIVVIGDSLENVVDVVRYPASPTFGWSPFVLRLTATGAKDPTFGDDGVTVLHEPERGLLFSSAGAVQPDGRIILVAIAARHGENLSHELVRLGADGRRDQSFASVTVPLRAVTTVSVIGNRALAGGFLRANEEGAPDTFAAAAVPLPA